MGICARNDFPVRERSPAFHSLSLSPKANPAIPSARQRVLCTKYRRIPATRVVTLRSFQSKYERVIARVSPAAKTPSPSLCRILADGTENASQLAHPLRDKVIAPLHSSPTDKQQKCSAPTCAENNGYCVEGNLPAQEEAIGPSGQNSTCGRPSHRPGSIPDETRKARERAFLTTLEHSQHRLHPDGELGGIP